jgi:hypothetical protein
MPTISDAVLDAYLDEHDPVLLVMQDDTEGYAAFCFGPNEDGTIGVDVDGDPDLYRSLTTGMARQLAEALLRAVDDVARLEDITRLSRG